MGVGFTELVGSENSAAHKASAPIVLERSAELPLLTYVLGQSFQFLLPYLDIF